MRNPLLTLAGGLFRAACWTARRGWLRPTRCLVRAAAWAQKMAWRLSR